MKNSFPKYCIGDSWPGQPVWIVRMRNPLLLARADERGLTGLHLDCWPASAEAATPPRKFARIIADMAAIWCDEVDELPGLPSNWSYAFAENFAPPEFLVVDGSGGSPFTGILQPTRGILWHVEERGDQITWVREFGGQPDFQHDLRAVAHYWRAFCAAEDAMPDEDEDDDEDKFYDDDDFRDDED